MCASGAAWAAPSPWLSVSWTPASAVAGSTGTVVTVTFVATVLNEGSVTVKVPGSSSGVPWTFPQTANPAAPGFVSVRSLGCQSATLSSVAPDGTITMNAKCAPRKAFALDYRATAATRVGAYAFQTRERVGRNSVPTAVQPVVAVGAGPLGRFAIAGLVDAVAGTAQSATAAAQDAFGNPLPGYNGSAALTSTDPLAELPATAAFANGSSSFAAKLKTSGLQSVIATDGTASGSQAVTIAAGPAVSLRLDGLGESAIAGAAQEPTVTLLDQYSNAAAGYRGTVRFTLTKPTPGGSDPNPDTFAPPHSGEGPADHTFTGADAGTHAFGGLLLKTIGTWGIAAADIAASQLKASASQRVVPGPVTNLDLLFPSPWLPFEFLQLPGQGLCRLTPRDANGNYVSTYAGTVRWTTTAASSDLPEEAPYIPFGGLITANNPYECMLLSPGTHDLTVTDVGDPTLTDTVEVEILPPSPQPDRATVQNPLAQGGVTLAVLDPLSNDPKTAAQGTMLRLFSSGQATYADGGATYQLGVARVDTDGRRILWDLNPPGDAVPSVPGATLVRCAPSGAGCTISQPITMDYTITDTVSTGSSTMALKIEPAPFALSLPLALNFAVTHELLVPADTIGLAVPTANMVIAGPLLFDTVTGFSSIPVAANYPCHQDADGSCTLVTNVTMALPRLEPGHTVTGINLSQSLDVLGDTSIRGYGAFRSVEIIQHDPFIPDDLMPYGGLIGSLVQVQTSTCWTNGAGSSVVACDEEPTGPMTASQIAGLAGESEAAVQNYLALRGYRLARDTACTNLLLSVGIVQDVRGYGTQNGLVPFGTLLTVVVFELCE